MGVMIERFVSSHRGELCAVELSTGEVLPCDLAVIGVGVKANSGLATNAGLDVDIGVRVDESLRTDDPSIFACGDAATFWHPLFDQYVRVEAWQNAEDHARVIARAVMGEKAVCDAVPWFWSDQYDLSLQIAGLPGLGSSMAARVMDDGAVILFHLTPGGKIVGATGSGGPIDRPRCAPGPDSDRQPSPSRSHAASGRHGRAEVDRQYGEDQEILGRLRISRSAPGRRKSMTGSGGCGRKVGHPDGVSSRLLCEDACKRLE